MKRKGIGFVIICLLFLSISAQSAKPDAVAGEDIIVMDASGSATVTLDASASSDDGSITNYYWVKNDTDTVSTAVTFNLDVTDPSTKITLRLVDDEGENDADVMFIFVGHPTNNSNNRIGIKGGDQEVFVSGMNIAWNSFARDLESFDVTDKAYFEQVMDSITLNGGNSLRWWLHTNGSVSPIFNSDGDVTGIDDANIEAMKQVLDMAFDREIVISMCLWSFDMLQDQGQNRAHTRGILEDAVKTQTYIDNALIPILEKIGDHPAIMTWEIFNEPEGMVAGLGGWADQTTDMLSIQRFINLTSGAIHRAIPTALVSNGSWSFKAMTDIEGNKNYYSDSELLAAGNDADGYLDFYQIHYYAEHFSNSFSPFHRPASHWGLDKPIVIGEFRSSGIEGTADPHLTTQQAYERAMVYGYAGAMSWSWTDTPISDFTETMGVALSSLNDAYASEIDIDNEGIVIEKNPEVISHISSIRQILVDNDTEIQIDLETIFYDEEDLNNLIYSISRNTNEDLVTVVITDDRYLDITIIGGVSGSSDVTIQATDTDGWSASNTFAVLTKSIAGNEGNFAFFKPVIASSIDNTDHFEIYINDGSANTRWSSAYTDDEWVTIDLENEATFNVMSLTWEFAFGSKYDILVSDDNVNWEVIYNEMDGDGEKDLISWNTPITTRYVKLEGKERGTEFGYSLYEWKVLNFDDTIIPEVVGSIEDINYTLGEEKSIISYVDLEDVFDYQLGVEYVDYTVESSDESLVVGTVDRSILNVLVTKGIVGEADLTVSALNPFGDKVETSFTFTVIDPPLASVGDVKPEITIYPNPSQLQFSISGELGSLQYVIIYDLSGALIRNWKAPSQAVFLLDGVESGSYIIKVITQENIYSQLLVKE